MNEDLCKQLQTQRIALEQAKAVAPSLAQSDTLQAQIDTVNQQLSRDCGLEAPSGQIGCSGILSWSTLGLLFGVAAGKAFSPSTQTTKYVMLGGVAGLAVGLGLEYGICDNKRV